MSTGSQAELPPEFAIVQGIFRNFQEEVTNSLLRRTAAAETADRFIAHSLRFSTDLRFNANVGLLEDGRPVYTFNLGACLALTDACITVCCDPEFFREIPLPDVISFGKPEEPMRFVDYGFALTADGLAWPFDRMLRDGENDAPRAQLGNHLFEMATKLLSLHEQGHALSGHLLYLRSLGVNRWREAVQVGEHGSLAPAQSRALEFQADAMALSIFAASQKVAPRRRTTARGFWMEEANTYLGFMRFLLIGMAVIVGIFDRVDKKNTTTPESRSHPSAAARLLNMLEMSVRWTRDEFQTPQDGDRWISGVLYECDRVFAALGCSRLDLEAVNEYFGVSDHALLRHPIAVEVADTGAELDVLVKTLEPHRLVMARLMGMPSG